MLVSGGQYTSGTREEAIIVTERLDIENVLGGSGEFVEPRTCIAVRPDNVNI
jgi:hypothetical protein